MIEQAEQYAENEWHIFPLKSRSKYPLKGSNGLNDSKPDIGDDWRDAYNIGCNAGKSGVFCLDVDLLNNKTIRNPFLAQLEDEELAMEISSAPRLVTPSGGEQFLFRCEVDEYQSNAGNIAPGVDVRCRGGYFLLPPSKTRDGEYRWDCAVIPDSPSDLPRMSDALIQFIFEKSKEKDKGKKVNFDGLEIGEGSRNDSLYRFGCKLRRVGFSPDELLEALIVANAQRCNPPMSDSEVKSIAMKASKHEPDQFATEMMDAQTGSNIVDLAKILGGGNKVDPEDYEENEDDAEDVEDEKGATKFDLPGPAGDMYRQILESAIYPSEALAFGGAMVAFSGLIERKWAGPLDGRANLEIVCLADSGSGKDHPRKWVSTLFRELEIDEKICNVAASKEGLEDYLVTHPAVVSLADEADGMLASLKNANDKLARSLWDYRLELYSSSGSHIRTRLKANGQGGAVIINPFLSVLSSAIPGMFFCALTEATILKGLVPRCIVLDAGKRGKANRNPSMVEPSKDLIKECKKFLSQGSKGNLEGVATAKPSLTRLEFGEDAREFYFDRIVDQADNRHDSLKGRGRKDYVLWSRVAENTMKLALIYTLSKEGSKAKTIDIESMAWAWNITSGAVEAIQGRINNVGNGRDSEEMAKIKTLVRSSRNQTMSHREILRATKLTKKVLDNYLETLVEAGTLSMGKRKNQHGRPSVVFSA